MTLEALLADPIERRQLVAATAADLRSGDPPDMLVSAGTEALVLTSMLAGELGLPMAYLRPRPKTHGRQQRVEGELRGRVILIAASSGAEGIRDYTALVAENGAHVSRVVPLPPRREGNYAEGVPAVHAPTLSRKPERNNVASDEGIARILLDIGAVVIRGEPFRYASGLLSPIYTDCRLLISHPPEWQAVLDSLSSKLLDATFDAVDGVATSGIPHASVLAYRLDKPLVYVDDGAIAGAPATGSQLVVVEDLVTTGKSVIEATGALRAAGLRVDRCFAIFAYDRHQPGLKTAGIAFEPLSELATLLDLGVTAGYFGAAERDAVLNWRRDPRDWTARHEPGSL